MCGLLRSRTLETQNTLVFLMGSVRLDSSALKIGIPGHSSNSFDRYDRRREKAEGLFKKAFGPAAQHDVGAARHQCALKELREFWASTLGIIGPQWMILVAIADLDKDKGVPVKVSLNYSGLIPHSSQRNRSLKNGHLRRKIAASGTFRPVVVVERRQSLPSLTSVLRPNPWVARLPPPSQLAIYHKPRCRVAAERRTAASRRRSDWRRSSCSLQGPRRRG